MNTLNKVMLIGYIGRDPSLNYTKTGKSVCNLSVATKRSYKVNDEWKTDTTWHSVVVWDRNAEFCTNNIVKGDLVYFEGYLIYQSYTDKDGNEVSKTVINANTIINMSKKKYPVKEDSKPLPSAEDADEIPF